MFSDPQFWVAVAFVLFILAVTNPIRKILKSSLDAKIKEIIKSIEEAENLKNESQETLSEIEKRQNDVQLEIKEINSSAMEKIKSLEIKSKIKLEEQIEKRKLLAEEKIEQLTRDANLAVKQTIAQNTIDTIFLILKDKLDQNEKQNLIDQSIKDLGLILKS